MKESNFKKAVNEILSFDFSGEGQKAKISEVTSKKSGKKEEPDRAAGEGMKEERIPHGEGQAVTVEASVPVQAGADMAAVGNTVPALKNESIITEDMVIDGSVRTKSNLRVLGQISGDVKCEGSLLLAGKVIGDIYEDSMRVQSGNITGNIQVTDEMVVDNNSWIKGDITSGRLMFNGHSEGNMMVKESVEFRESARVKGNVSSECISMYNGAHVKGMIDIGGIEEIKEE